MILTPEQIEIWEGTRDIFDTLAAYAEIVQKVAEAEPWEYGYSDEPICFYCKAYNQHRDEATSKIVHAPNCLWLRARKLRGME